MTFSQLRFVILLNLSCEGFLFRVPLRKVLLSQQFSLASQSLRKTLLFSSRTKFEDNLLTLFLEDNGTFSLASQSTRKTFLFSFLASIKDVKIVPLWPIGAS